MKVTLQILCCVAPGEADRTNVLALRDFARDRKMGFALCAIQQPTADDHAPLFDTGLMRD